MNIALKDIAELIRAGGSRTNGNRIVADFDRTIVKEKGITLLRCDASAVSAPCDGHRLALQAHTSPAALLALAVEAMELGHSSVYLTLTVAVSDARAAVKAAQAPKPAPPPPPPAQTAPKGLDGLLE
jgi:hypothetical protein